MFEREIAELDAEIEVITAATSRLLERIAYLDEVEVWAGEATSMCEWLSWRYSLTWATASEWLRVARALRRLPAIAKAYADKRLSWDQLRPLTKFATPETDERWAVEGAQCRVGWLWREAARHEKVRREEANEHHRGRYVRFDWDENKTEVYLSGRLAAEQGAALEQAVMNEARKIELTDDPYDPAEAKAADALVSLVTQDAPAPVVVVHAEVEAVEGTDQEDTPVLAETQEGVRLCSEAVRRLTCYSKMEWVLEHNGLGVGIGFQSPRIPPWLERQVRQRDLHCRFPGCRRRRGLRSHHVVHWPHGPTDLDNLVSLCETHHRAVHEGGWTIRGTPSKGLRFFDPRGRPMEDPARLVA